MYATENYDKLLYPSMESEEDAQLKTKLIRQNVKEHMQELDGELIESILENPK